jgi:hypothetical protein
MVAPVRPDIPFVALPSSVVSLDDLMDFDRKTCCKYQQFRRSLHVSEKAVTEEHVPGSMFVLVTGVAPGIRSRMLVGRDDR